MSPVIYLRRTIEGLEFFDRSEQLTNGISCMSKLTLIENAIGLEFHIDEEANIAYASIRAVARMVGKDASTISRWIGVASIDVLQAEIQTPGGVQGVALLNAEQVFEAALKWSPELAKKMGACGANVFMLGAAGYEVRSSIPAPQRQLAPQRDLKDWIECARIMGVAEDPILRSLATQRLAEEMGGPRNLDIPQPIVLTVRAQQLGISQADIGTGVKLGKYIVKSGFLPQGKSQHGKYEVNVYAASSELDEAILEFFDHG